MIFDYYYCNPTGNITLLVDTPVSRRFYLEIALRLMEKEPTAEQVGFLETENDLPHLQMAGGEFCGNATMSAASVYALKNNIISDKITLTVSGADKEIAVDIKNINGEYEGSVHMPDCKSVKHIDFTLGDKELTLPIVELPGISHIISEGKLTEAEVKANIADICHKLGLDCLGIMLLSGDKIIPYVYVKTAKTLFRESSCASGTTATGIYLSQKDKNDIDINFTEPGGVLNISVTNSKAILSGKVTVTKKQAEI